MLTTPLVAIFLLRLGASVNALALNASPPALKVTKRIDYTKLYDIVQHDLSRAKVLKARGQANAGGKFNEDAAVNVPITNEAVDYVMTISIGNPPTNYTCIVDTGSSNCWIGAGKTYVATSTSEDTGATVSVSYGSGSFSGKEWVDRFALAADLVISQQSFGVASSSSGFSGVDGICGLGPVDLTEGTVSGQSTIPTIMTNLCSQGTLPACVLGIQFAPTDVESTENGELTFGGTDSSKYTGSINYVPLTSTQPASFYWGIDQTITYGTTSKEILPSTAGIVDTGTTLLLIASDAFSRYCTATGAKVDDATGLAIITSSQFASLQSLNFVIGGVTYEFTANAQLWPRALNTFIGGTTGSIYLIVGDLGTPSGQGLDFINGYAFFERFYVVLDTTNNRVGFATTPNTASTIN